MAFRTVLFFILKSAAIGLLAAAIVILISPNNWLNPKLKHSPVFYEASPNPKSVVGPYSYAAAVARAAPAVVNIYTKKLLPGKRTFPSGPADMQRFLDDLYNNQPRDQQATKLGSGVIVSQQGHILTSNHVIENAAEIEVALQDGRRFRALAVGVDPETDLAVLKIKAKHLPSIHLAQTQNLAVGDVVLAIGNPYGFGHSVSQGIISGLSRYGLQASDYEDYIQTDASVLLGSSGGALIDASGKLLGINTLIYTANGEGADNTAIGINLATPVNLAHFVMQDLVNYGTVVRGWLGVSVELLLSPETMAQQKQVLLVSALTEDGPAARAGLQLGDVISAINGNTVNDGRITMHQIARFRPGEIVDIEVARGSEQEMIQLQAVVGTRPGG